MKIILVFIIWFSSIFIFQNNEQNWVDASECLEENIASFNSKVYDKNGDLLRIQTYEIENDQLIFQTFIDSTKSRHLKIFDLNELSSVQFSKASSNYETLHLNFNLNDGKVSKKIELSNCMVYDKSENCQRKTWSSEDDFVIKSLDALDQIISLNLK